MKHSEDYNRKTSKKGRREMIQYINLQLAALGQPIFTGETEEEEKLTSARFISLTEGLVNSFREKSRLLTGHLSPADTRIQNFVNDYLKDLSFNKVYKLPDSTLRSEERRVGKECRSRWSPYH